MDPRRGCRRVSHQQADFHEVDAFLWFDQHGLSPYWALGSLCVDAFDGFHETTVEIDGEPWAVRLNYSPSGIAPREHDAVGGDVLYEYDVHCEGPNRQKASFNVSPRFDGMHGPDGDTLSIPWCGGEGTDVHTQGSNLPYEAYPYVLRAACAGLAADAGRDWNRQYFSRPRGDSNIVTTELYVRFTRDMQQKLVRSDGVFMKLMHLLSEEKGAEWVYSGDNTDIVGKRHAFAVESHCAGALVDDHDLGKRLKTYHPKYVRSEETRDDPLSSPKFGVAFHKSLSDGAVSWAEREDLLRELEETLINVLDWADVPTQPTEAVFVADDNFSIRESERSIGRFADPTPDLEAEQDHIVAWALSDLSPSGSEIVETLATDGGQHYSDLADETGYSISQIYRALEEIGGAVVNDNGAVRLFSEKIKQDVQALVESVEEAVTSGVSRIASLAAVDRRSAADSAFQKWCAKYGVDFQRVADGDGQLRFDTVLSEIRSLSVPYMPDVLAEGLEAWTRAGRDPGTFLEMRYLADVEMGSDRGLVRRTIA